MARVLRVIALVMFVSVLCLGCKKEDPGSKTGAAIGDAIQQADKEGAKAVEDATK